MIVCIDHILTADQLKDIHERLKMAKFVDGKQTAGTFAKTVKHNQQLHADDPNTQSIQSIIQRSLHANSLFQAIARPKTTRLPLINRHEAGMSYGWHTDNAIMGTSALIRSDVSLTVFLSDPDSYSGGELVIDTGLGEQSFKLVAGSMIVYPSTFLHRVAEVEEGVRIAAVSWVQSLVRQAQHRELLFDLDTVRRSVFEKYGKTDEFDLLSKTHANLLRQWAEV
jgi:PKHD-type hydroxylase